MKKYVFCLLFFLGSVSAAVAESSPVVEVTSTSGIRAWLVQDSKLPLMSMRFAFKGGVEDDPQDQQGLAVLAVSLLTQGAGAYDDQAFQAQLARHSIEMSVGAGRDYIDGNLKTLRREKDKAFELLALALTKPRFDSKAFDRALRQQKTAYKMQMASPAWQGRYALYSRIFKDHPYSFRSLGTEDTLKNLTRQAAMAFVKNHLAKNNLYIAVVGDIAPQELKEALDKIFGKLPARRNTADIPDVRWPEAVSRILVERHGTQTNMLFVMPSLRRNDPDWYVARVADYILGGGGFVSRLMKAVRAEEGLTYGISTSLTPMEKASMLMGQVSMDNENAVQVWQIIQSVWFDFYEKGITDSELMAAKDYMIGSLPLALTSTSEIAEVVLTMQERGLGRDYLTRRAELYQNITREDVNRVIRKWFNPSFLNLSLVGQPVKFSVDETRPLILGEAFE